jgi:sulfite exporter TauE/SafE
MRAGIEIGILNIKESKMDGFLLGLSNGITCVASCAPVMIPLFLGQGRRMKSNGWLLAQFLFGRLVGYLLFGLLAWVTGHLLFQGGGPSGWIFGGVYLLMGALLLLYGLGEFIKLPQSLPTGKDRQLSAASYQRTANSASVSSSRGNRHFGCPVPPRRVRQWLNFAPALFPLALGFLTGLNLCLPFMAAFAGAVGQASIAASVLFFAAFFAGTAVFFLPIPFVGAFHRVQALRTIGRFAAIFVALYYLYTGGMYILGGMIS